MCDPNQSPEAQETSTECPAWPGKVDERTTVGSAGPALPLPVQKSEIQTQGEVFGPFHTEVPPPRHTHLLKLSTEPEHLSPPCP